MSLGGVTAQADSAAARTTHAAVRSGERRAMGESVDSADGRCPRPGRYRHHKGADYRVLGCVRHSETEERLVLYRALYGERGLWVRPLGLFVGTVPTAEGPVPRFRFLHPEDDAGG